MTSHELRLGTYSGRIALDVKTYRCFSRCLALSVTASIGCTFTVLCICVSKNDVDVRGNDREQSLSACCFRNFSLAPAPPGVFE